MGKNAGTVGESYNRARYYDAVAGRFLSEDPKSQGPLYDNPNRYEYVENNPANGVNPLGLYTLDKHQKIPLLPPSPEIDNLLKCIESKTGLNLDVTSTSEPTPRHRPGTPISPKNIAHRVLRPTCVRLGLRSIGWHALRHTHATWLSESGATIRAAQDILGQSDLETTLRVYTHAVPYSKRRAIANVAALLFPSVPPQGREQKEGQQLIS